MVAVRWLALLLLLAGCRNVPRPVTLPPQVSSPAIAERLLAPEDRAAALADTVAAAPQPDDAGPMVLTLTEAIDFALRNQPRLRVAQATWERAVAEEQIAFAPFLPQVDLAYRYVGFDSLVQPSSATLTAVTGLGTGTQDFSQAELNLQWMLWDFGRTASRYGQAASRQQVASLQLQRAAQTVAFDVVHAYLLVLHARAARVVQEEAGRRAEAVLRDTRNRRKGGVADRDDVLRAEVQVSEAREALVAARQAELDRIARLNLTLGRNVSLPLQVVDTEERPGFDLSLTDCLELALGGRREVEIARQTVAGAVYGLEAERAEFRPRIYVKSSASRIDGAGIQVGDVLGAGIHCDIPLYQGGRRIGQRDAASAEVRAAAATAQSILDSIALEVNLAYREIAAARERIALAESALVQAREYLRLVRVKYDNGDATPTDIVEAETTLTRSQQRLFASTYAYLLALARLDYAVGRDPGQCFQPLPLPAPQPLDDEGPALHGPGEP